MTVSPRARSFEPQPLILVPESDGHTVVAYLTGALWETLALDVKVILTPPCIFH
jgi:hypothetical protein